MSSPTVADPAMETPPALASAASAPAQAPVNGSLHSQIGEIANSLCRLADLQLAIWLAGVKLAVRRMVFIALLALGALLLTLLALIFLYAGIYHVLTDLWGVPTAWALLIFAGAHGLLACILVLAAQAMVRHRGPRKLEPGGVK